MKARIKWNNDLTPGMWEAYTTHSDGRETLLYSAPETFNLITFMKMVGFMEEGTSEEAFLASLPSDEQRERFTKEINGYEALTDFLKEQGYELEE